MSLVVDRIEISFDFLFAVLLFLDLFPLRPSDVLPENIA